MLNMAVMSLVVTIVALVVMHSGVATGYMPHLSPFFFLCNYHGNVQDLGFDSGEVTLSISIKGDPQFYLPGQFYEVTLSSSINFDGLLLTGLYTMSTETQAMLLPRIPQAPGIVGQNLMCSVVHSHLSPRPQHQLSFVWMAPPEGTGCVKFLATATLGQQLLFKDTTVLQMCEEGSMTAPTRPELAEIHSQAVIFREDFETTEDLRQDLWLRGEGVEVTDKCGPVVYGQHALLCRTSGVRELVTVPLNTTSAKILQFSLAFGSCEHSGTEDGDIVVSVGLMGCSQWTDIDVIRLSESTTTEIHLIHLPPEARGVDVCFRWSQLPTFHPAEEGTTMMLYDRPTPTTTTTTTTLSELFNASSSLSSSPELSSSSHPAISSSSSTYPPTATTTKRRKSSERSRRTSTQSTTEFPQFGEVLPNDEENMERRKYRRVDVMSDGVGVDGYVDDMFEGCWALDNVVMVNVADLPSVLEERFDPIDPSQWLFFPGAHVQHQCQSEGNAFVFDDRNQSVTYGTTRDLNLNSISAASEAVLFEPFEASVPDSWSVSGGATGSQCGAVSGVSSLVVDGAGKRQVCTPFMDATTVGAARFVFGMGVGPCSSSGAERAAVVFFLEDQDDQTTVLARLLPRRYTEAQTVSLPVSYQGKGERLRLCWLQKRHQGPSQDVWVLDDVAVLPLVPPQSSPDSHLVLQASLNLQCHQSADVPSSVQLEMSSDHGHTWHTLYTPCWPSLCHGRHQSLSSVWSSDQTQGWNRVTLPLPYYALTPQVRFRFLQTQGSGAEWALDDVYIGSCPERCNGHGRCTTDGCSCDFDYTGATCHDPVIPHPTTMTENFEDPALLGGTPLLQVQGGSLSYVCDVLASGKALVFDKGGLRQITTTEFNTTDASYLQFSIRVGSHSVKSDCPPSSDGRDVVILEYSCDGGITWTFMKDFAQDYYRIPRSDSVTLPQASRGEFCQFRWRQIGGEGSGSGRAVWAIDDVVLTPHLTNTLLMDMGQQSDMSDRVTANNGQLLHNYCGAPRSIVFNGQEENEEPRFLMTEAVQISPGYMVQFDLVMGCGQPYTTNLNNQVLLQYSVDHGITWLMAEDPCLPPDVCQQYQAGTVYDASQFPEWTTVTVLLSPDTWSPHTRFRWVQEEWGSRDDWAVRRVYVGHQCPSMCGGHGQCNEGVCKCEPGFEGDMCKPDHEMKGDLHADFGIRYDPDSHFLYLLGGEVVHAGEGCGVILSGESMYFYKDGVRELQTKDMNVEREDYLQFYLRIAGGGNDACRGAERRGESVLLQYSTDGGITWTLLQELHHLEFQQPRFVHLDLPMEAKTGATRFRWWQPEHNGHGHDQWALDEVLIGRYERLRTLHDDFDTSSDPLESGQWRTVTDGVVGKYCQSHSPSLILGNQPSDKYVISKDLHLSPGDIIQFKINVGCGKQFRWDHPVMLQFSHDSGQSWQLVQEPCYQLQDCDHHHTEGTIFYTGTHGVWTLVVIPVDERIAMHPAILRWWQPGGMSYSFSLDDIYVGPPCPDNCHRRGVCREGQCHCDSRDEDGDYEKDPHCQPLSDQPNPLGMLDRFDNRNMPTDYWRRVLGGYLGTSCGIIDFGNSLYFDGPGTREAVTVPLDTSERRMLEFVVRVGSVEHPSSCQLPEHRSEGVIVDYSTDNEVTWHLLKVVEPHLQGETTQTVTLELPPEAKTNATIFRWWQPLGLGGVPRAGWALDSVLVGVNDTSAFGFQDDFSGASPNPFTWFLADTAVPRITCNSKGHALEFSTNGGMRYAETWDYHITPSTFLQFDIAMGCGSLHGTLFSVMLEYSVNMGKTWHPVVSECKPPSFHCSGYHFSSSYLSDQHLNWTRITVYLPPGAVSPTTRFRWLQQSSHPRGTVWALDNVYLGDGCPWLCSGHGYCQNHTCVCDPGFAEPFCVPETPLPMELHEDFNNDQPDRAKWTEIYGGDMSDMCGRLVSGNALVFHKDHVRLAVTNDIDTTMLTTVEFYFKYGCEHKDDDDLGDDSIISLVEGKGRGVEGGKKKAPSWPRHHSVLLQYSTNGGISWTLLKEIHYPDTQGVRFFSVGLPMMALTNATRFRFWQPKNGGEMKAAWAIDNLFIGAMSMNPATMMDDFEVDHIHPSPWLFINNGQTDEYCTFKTRWDTQTSGGSALVFRRGAAGEVSVSTRDLEIGPMSVLQFDINVGCGSEPTDKYPVRLEYTSDGGITWSLVAPNCAGNYLARCFDTSLPPTVYYGGTTAYWRRIIVPLDAMSICGSLRFRWYQGSVPADDFAPEWAIDNVYVGMACMDHCHGHGSCLGGMACLCDAGHGGPTCVPDSPLPTYLKEDFYLTDIILPRRGDVLPGLVLDTSGDLNEDVWEVWGGGRRSLQCGEVFTGTSLLQATPGDRELTTLPLDLTHTSMVQFFAKLGCGLSVEGMSPPVFLQYSIDGGVHWISIEQFDFSADSNVPSYLSIHLPPHARTNATQVRWWQPSKEGVYSEDWAIDQIYIGGDIFGGQLLQDDPRGPRDSTWLMYPGGIVEPVCGSPLDALHFNDVEVMRYAVSADISVEAGTVLQFHLSMGCQPTEDCYEIHLEFSLDMGQTWSLLVPACLPSDLQCSHYYTQSTYSSDLHAGWNRVTIILPERARSKSTRFRWVQPVGFEQQESWALSHLYIGSQCPGLCTGHGRCDANACLCDEGWEGNDCSVSTSPLPTLLTEDFNDDYEEENWVKVIGGKVTKPCRVLSAGEALHFTGGCTRMLESRDLNLTKSMLVQFYFMFGCTVTPVGRDQGVLLDYSPDGGITWEPLAELYYNLYRTPTFISVKLPPGAKKQSTRFRWWQPEHGGPQMGDWIIDGIRVNGEEVNPSQLTLNFSSGFDFRDMVSADNMKVGDYCGEKTVAVGTTEENEASQLVSREVYVADGYQLQFVANIGCGAAHNRSLPPLHLQYSTDHGLTWNYFYPPCHDANAHCARFPSMPSVLYGHAWPVWERVVVPLYGLPTSNGTRFRWRQEPGEEPQGDDPEAWQWALKDVYVGEACPHFCRGHGYCQHPLCVCDHGYTGPDCSKIDGSHRPTYLRDSFGEPPVNVSQWGVVQGGGIGEGCEEIMEGNALVFSAPGLRQAATVDLDLQNARFVQYTAMIGGLTGVEGCVRPHSRHHNVYLQYSVDGGIMWHTLHVLDHTRYLPARTDYIPLPREARTHSTRLRWWQPPTPGRLDPRPQWAIDDVLIGGWEINPSYFQQTFDPDTPQKDDGSRWEFHPHGSVVDSVCAREESALAWEEEKGDSGQRSFTTAQLIVQPGYMLQFKLAVGCSQHYNVCQPLSPVTLEFNKNPLADRWELVQPLCLPDSNDKRSQCRPHVHHDASVYSVAHHPTWTRITINLHEKTHSSSTRFRWRQAGEAGVILPSWAIDDVYVGEKCADMCHGRGDCRHGVCQCDKGYYGATCMPQRSRLLKRMFESFEGGIFSAHWHTVSGGNIGFGCGALRPYAHGKTLYFNGCGVRQAVTTEMDTSYALKVIFVLQIGCQAQTSDCNVLLGEGPNYRGVLLQYSHNEGAEWHLLARHDPKDFLRPQRVAYDLPAEAKRVGLRLRWWQPVHDGIGHDQWAIDHIEIISGYRRYSRKRPRG